MAVSNLALHPSKSAIVSVSDDQTWKLWDVFNGQLILTGEGHSDWVSGVDFHPQGKTILFIIDAALL